MKEKFKVKLKEKCSQLCNDLNVIEFINKIVDKEYAKLYQFYHDVKRSNNVFISPSRKENKHAQKRSTEYK